MLTRTSKCPSFCLHIPNRSPEKTALGNPHTGEISTNQTGGLRKKAPLVFCIFLKVSVGTFSSAFASECYAGRVECSGVRAEGYSTEWRS